MWLGGRRWGPHWHLHSSSLLSSHGCRVWCYCCTAVLYCGTAVLYCCTAVLSYCCSTELYCTAIRAGQGMLLLRARPLSSPSGEMTHETAVCGTHKVTSSILGGSISFPFFSVRVAARTNVSCASTRLGLLHCSCPLLLCCTAMLYCTALLHVSVVLSHGWVSTGPPAPSGCYPRLASSGSYPPERAS